MDPNHGKKKLFGSQNNNFFLIKQNQGLTLLTCLDLPLSNRGQHGGTKVNTLKAD